MNELMILSIAGNAHFVSWLPVAGGFKIRVKAWKAHASVDLLPPQGAPVRIMPPHAGASWLHWTNTDGDPCGNFRSWPAEPDWTCDFAVPLRPALSPSRRVWQRALAWVGLRVPEHVPTAANSPATAWEYVRGVLSSAEALP